jgi:hypothetical protein
MQFLKVLQNINNKRNRKKGTRAYYNNGEIYFSRLYGYLFIQGRYEPDLKYSPAIETIFSMLANGNTLPQIKQKLDEKGYRDSSNNKYSLSRIITIASRITYAGYIQQHGKMTAIKNLTPIVNLNIYKLANKKLVYEKQRLNII